MGPILNALSSGFTSQQIVDYLIRKFPQHAAKIQSALSMGFSPAQVIKYVVGGRKELNQPEPQMTEHEQTRASEAQRKTQINQAALGAGAVAAGGLGTYALSRALPSIAQQLAPQLAGRGPQMPSPTPPAAQTQPQAPVPHQAPVSPVAPQAQTPMIPPVAPAPLPTKSIKDLGLSTVVDSIASSGNAPEQIAGALQTKEMQQRMTPEQKKVIRSMSPEEIQNSVAEHVAQMPPQKEMSTETTRPENVLQKEEKVNISETPIVKGSLAYTPEGHVGEVKGSDKKGVLVEVNGKTKKFSHDQLEPPPMPEKDLADLLQDLLTGIEKDTGEEVSRMASFVGYDPKNNELAFKPYVGATYTYTDISPEDIKLLTSVLNQRKTTGENYIGAWVEGSKSPIGAAMSALIQKLQKQAGGKGKEYARKYEPVYDYSEIAHRKLKEKKSKEKKDAKSPKAKRKKTIV